MTRTNIRANTVACIIINTIVIPRHTREEQFDGCISSGLKTKVAGTSVIVGVLVAARISIGVYAVV